MACADGIGTVRVIGVEQLAGNQPAFHPPRVAVDQQRRILSCGDHQVGGFGDVGCTPCALYSSEGQAGIVGEALRYGRDGGVDSLFAGGVDDAGSRQREQSHVWTGQCGGPKRGLNLLLVEQPIGAKFVIVARDERAEFLEDCGFLFGIDVRVTPDIANDHRCFERIARTHVGARQGELAIECQRLCRREPRHHGSGIVIDGEHQLFEAAVEPGLCGPIRMSRGEHLHPGETRFPRIEADRHPFERQAKQRTADGFRELVALRDLALSVKRDCLVRVGDLGTRVRRTHRNWSRGLWGRSPVPSRCRPRARRPARSGAGR